MVVTQNFLLLMKLRLLQRYASTVCSVIFLGQRMCRLLYNSIQFIFISPQTSQYIGQHNEKNYIDGEKGHFAELVSNSLKLTARKLTKSANFADYSPNCSPMLRSQKIYTNITWARHNYGKWDAGHDLSSEGREFHWVASRKENE
jgi:hypothetical protein